MSFTAVITANVSEFEKGIQSAQKSVNGLEKDVSSKLQSVGSKFTDLGDKVKFVSAAFLAAGAASFKMAADFQDAIGATDQIFKSNSKAVQDWAKNLPSMYGIATKEALEYSNKMATMLVNIGGLTEEQAGKQSASLIELAGDLTAMFGGETKDAVWTLTAALKGNNAMLDNYGIAANDALIKARAFEMGLVEQGKEMSLTAKQAATLSIIYEQTAAAQGQAAREADGASGTMRALGVEFKNLSTELGTKLLPIFTPMLTGLRDLVANIRTLSPEVITAGLVFGGLVVAAAPLLLIIGKIITLLPTLIAGFAAVKVAIIAMTGPIGLLVAAIAAAVIAIIANWDEIKAYFTSGGGSEMFTAIKELAQSVWDRLVYIFNGIKDFVKTVWGAIGGTVKDIWSDAVGTVGSLLEFFMDYIKTAANFWRDIVNLDFKSALESLKANFNVIFSFIGRIVTNVLSAAAGALAGFLDIIGLDKWSSSVQKFADKMAVAFVKPEKAIEKTTTAVKKQVVAVKEAVKELDKIDGVGGGIGSKMSSAGLDFGTLSTPIKGLTIPAPTFDLEAASKTLTDLGNFREAVATNFIELGNLAASGLGSFADAVGNALGSGNFDDLGSELISALGSLAQQFGGMLISFGLASKQLQLLITNPVAAIAAGVALVALGAAAKASASKMVSNATSGGNYSTGGTSSYQTATTLGTSDYRGQYKDDYTVNFKIGSNELVGVLEMANNRKNRL